MRSYLRFSLALALVIAAAFAGCSNDDAGNSTTTGGVTGVGGSVVQACNNGGPDGFCVTDGAVPESCECSDCATTARCAGGCKDDGQCDLQGGEDCSCADCHFKVAECPPYSVGCDGDGENDGTCAVNEDCTCGDCTNTPRCKDNCDDNGSCVPYLEGCSCADCKNSEACGGSGESSSSTTTSSTTTTTTTTGAGGGGSGGAPGSGGAGGAGGQGS